MATTKTSEPLGRKTSTSYWSMGSGVIFKLSLLICVGITSACNYLFLFTSRFDILFFSFFINYNLLFLNRETDIWQVTVCTLFHPLFYSIVTSNSIPPYISLFYFRVTSNFILPYSFLFYFSVSSNSISPYSPLFNFGVTSIFIPPRSR